MLVNIYSIPLVRCHFDIWIGWHSKNTNGKYLFWKIAQAVLGTSLRSLCKRSCVPAIKKFSEQS